MPHLFVKTLQRGDSLKIMISILKVQGDNAETQTEQINVDISAAVILKFKCVANNEIVTFIRMKNTLIQPLLSNCTKKILISGTFDDIFSLSDKWVEAKMQSIVYNNNITINNQSTLSYFIEVNITTELKGSLIMWPCRGLYEDTEFTDVELQATDGNVSVHKMALMAHSKVFTAMMKGEWKENLEGLIKIDGVTVKTLKHLKAYIYLGTLPVEGLESLLVLAARYLMDILVSSCILKIIETMKPKDFDGLVKLACQHNIPELVRALVLYTPDDVINGIHQLKTKG